MYEAANTNTEVLLAPVMSMERRICDRDDVDKAARIYRHGSWQLIHCENISPTGASLRGLLDGMLGEEFRLTMDLGFAGKVDARVKIVRAGESPIGTVGVVFCNPDGGARNSLAMITRQKVAVGQ